MDFVNYSDLNPLVILFSFGIIGGIFSFIGTIGKALFGGTGGATTTSTAKIDYKQMLADQKKELEEQMDAREKASKRTIMIIGLGAGALIFIMVIFMVVGKK